MASTKYLDRIMRDFVQQFGARSPLSAGKYYEHASRSVEDGHRVILEHLGIRNEVEVIFTTGNLPWPADAAKTWAGRPGRIILPRWTYIRKQVRMIARADATEDQLQKIRTEVPIRIEVDSLFRDDIRAIGAVLAHEDTHLFQWLWQHPLEDVSHREIVTDVACVVLGLGELVANGRHRYRGYGIVENMGYLDEESVEYVRERVSRIQSELEPGKGGPNMAGIKCANCGYEKNQPGDQFCGDCGVALQAQAAAPPPAAAGPAPTVVPPSAASGPHPQELQAAAQQQQPPAAKAKLVVKRNGRIGQEFPIDQDSATIGRWDADSGSFAEVDLSNDDADKYVSRKHARIFLKDGQYFLEDVGSLNGTYLNKGPRLIPGTPQKLQSGDEVIIGRTFFQFVVA